MTDDFNPTEWITTKEAAELTGYSTNHIRRLVREGRIKSRRFGRAWMVLHKGILAHVEEMENLGATKYDPWRVGARQRKTESKD